MTDPSTTSAAGPSVCPFVALAEDRDRRADKPHDGNRCYAERAPRRRDLVYQADYCYSPEFAACSVFLAWAARNAAQPTPAARAVGQPTEPGVSAEGTDSPGTSTPETADEDALPQPSPERGLFGLTRPADPDEITTAEQLDWVSASAWASAPWDERAEAEAAELEELEEDDLEELDDDELDDDELDDDEERSAEALQPPKVPAALPLRKRRPPQEPIRSRGSGEWFYAEPPAREPLVSRRYGVTPSILLAVLGILLVSIVVFLIATQIGGGGEDTPVAAASPLPDPNASFAVVATQAPSATTTPSEEPEASKAPRRRFYTVKAGDSLTGIAARFDVRPNHLQCLNGILNKNLVVVGARLEIPPEGFSCPSGWRNATPAP